FDPNENLEYIDQGIQRFRYRIVAIESGLDVTRLAREGATICARLFAHLESAHESQAPALERTFEGMAVEPDNVIATVVKKSEDGDGWIVRVYESSGIATNAIVRSSLLGAQWEFAIGAYELRTFHVTREGVSKVDLTEIAQ
ncbi:MAG: hypothetical protein H7X80_10510, partial [bacterium]|nr:hypothetical protein [Candidatus Kapabacteria bacterium]